MPMKQAKLERKTRWTMRACLSKQDTRAGHSVRREELIYVSGSRILRSSIWLESICIAHVYDIIPELDTAGSGLV